MFRHHGYTLVELTLVSALLGIIAMMVIPNLSSTDPSRLDIAALEIADAMRYARSEAIRVGIPRGFRHQFGHKRIRVMRPDMGTTPATLIYDIYHPISKKLYDTDLDDEPFVAVDTVNEVTTFRGTCNQPGDVYFDANGTPWCVDPPTVLLDQFDVPMTLGSHTRVVTLHGFTGRVTIQ